jgi:hypothetical protein
MINITSLPRESLQMIFEYLEPQSRSSSKSDLYHCTQVCKLWYDIATRVLYRRFWIYIASPPSPNDVVRRFFTAPHLSLMQEVNILVTAGAHVYTTQQECDDIIDYLQQATSMASSTANLRFAELDLSVFTPADCLPNLWRSLQPANSLLVTLVQTIVTKDPGISLTLSRPDIMSETQVETISRPIFNNILDEARGQFQSLSIGCRLSWLLRWIRDNPQLREIYYTRISSEDHEMQEFWEVVRSSQSLDKLMLDGFDFPSIQKLPVRLVELILTHLDDTVRASNAILKHLPNLRLVSLRLQRNTIEDEENVVQSIEQQQIVCRGLRKAWWTMSTAPKSTVRVVSKACEKLESISPPRNVTNDDLVIMSQTAARLTEIWMMDCPKITEMGLRSLKNLHILKHVQLRSHFASFLTQDFIADFLACSSTLLQITLVFDGAQDENIRRAELWSTIPGHDEYHEILRQAISFQSSNLGDKIIINVKIIRELL